MINANDTDIISKRKLQESLVQDTYLVTFKSFDISEDYLISFQLYLLMGNKRNLQMKWCI